MRPWYAINARNLLETRRQGMQPEGQVNVAMSGGEFSGTALYVRPEMPTDRMDWRMLVNLKVCIWASAEVSLSRLVDTVSRVASVRPDTLVLHFDDGQKVHQIDVGRAIHWPAILEFNPVHEFYWCPINLGFSSIGGSLVKALQTKHKDWSVL